MVLCEENVFSKKLKIVCVVKVSRLEFGSLNIADQLQPNFYKLPCSEQRITKLDLNSTLQLPLLNAGESTAAVHI